MRWFRTFFQWKLFVFTGIAVGWYIFFQYNSLDFERHQIYGNLFGLFLGIYVSLGAAYVAYNSTHYRRTSERFIEISERVLRFARHNSPAAQISNDLKSYLDGFLSRFAGILSAQTKYAFFEGYSTPLPIYAEDSLDNMEDGGYKLLVSIYNKTASLESSYGELCSIFDLMAKLEGIHLTSVPAALYRILTFYTIISYGLIIPAPWMWFGWIWGSVLIALIIILLVIFMEQTKKITSIFDPLSLEHYRCTEVIKRNNDKMRKIF